MPDLPNRPGIIVSGDGALLPTTAHECRNSIAEVLHPSPFLSERIRRQEIGLVAACHNLATSEVT